MKRTTKQQTDRGFTLIELLVVIAIIAILAAILFPVFAQTREKARQSSCLSNEKQIGLAVMQYVQDFDETYPMMRYDNNSAEWNELTQPYIKSGRYGAGGVFDCPSVLVPDQNNQYAVSNALFQDFFDVANSPAYDNTPRGVALSELSAPSSYAMLVEHGQRGQFNPGENYNVPYFRTEAWLWEDTGSPYAPGKPSPPAYLEPVYDTDLTNGPGGINWTHGYWYPRYRHSKTANVLFADGHVKAMQKGRLRVCTNLYIETVNNDGYCPKP